MPANDAPAAGGFRDPVFDAQRIFRLVMDAMARPGTRQDCGLLTTAPQPLTPHAGMLALMLCDHDTPVWLDPPLAASDAVAEWLAFHTGAPIVTVSAEAQFAFVSEPAKLIGLENFAQGRQDYPDRSTTLILEVESFDAGTSLTLSGPGIRESETLAPAPLPPRFLAQWAENNARFPRGVDLILAGPEGFAALPRTTRITGKEDMACM